MTENIQYYGKAVTHGGAVLTATFIIRGALAPFSHPLFTSMTGIGLGLSRQSTNQAVKFITPVLGLFMAMTMHGIWKGRNGFTVVPRATTMNNGGTPNGRTVTGFFTENPETLTPKGRGYVIDDGVFTGFAKP